jgi:predicted transposase YbfD/YdcC
LNQITLGEIAVNENSNKITAISELLGLIDTQGSIERIDAMGTQTKIAEKVIEKKADYRLALKGNQSNLHEYVKLYLNG